jgi:hypothetical protein
MNNELEHVRGVIGLSSLARVDDILVQRGILVESTVRRRKKSPQDKTGGCERLECVQMKTLVELLLRANTSLPTILNVKAICDDILKNFDRVRRRGKNCLVKTA